MSPTEIIQELQLDKYSNSTIQKVIGGSINIYVITLNSRYPQKFIPYSLLKNTLTSQTYKIKPEGVKKSKLTPPVDLKSFSFEIPTNSYIVVRDLGGENFLDYREIEPLELVL
jgi:hypothetical protein